MNCIPEYHHSRGDHPWIPSLPTVCLSQLTVSLRWYVVIWGEIRYLPQQKLFLLPWLISLGPFCVLNWQSNTRFIHKWRQFMQTAHGTDNTNSSEIMHIFKPELEAAEEMKQEGGGDMSRICSYTSWSSGTTLHSSTFKKIGLILKYSIMKS